MKRLLAAASLLSLVVLAQAPDEINARIRKEEAEHSQIMHTLHVLTDRYGPRLTGSPNHEAAAKWVVQQMTEWGFRNARLEPWDFGHPGWLNESAVGRMIAPTRANLKFEVLGWTPSTRGPLTASALQLVPPQGPMPPPAQGGGRRGRGATPTRL